MVKCVCVCVCLGGGGGGGGTIYRAGRPTDEVDLNRFRKTLNLVEGNPNKWSLCIFNQSEYV